jgi:hypothetical protein
LVGSRVSTFFLTLLFKLENNRPFEIEALNETPNIHRTLLKGHSDIIFFRNKPESTTDQDYNKLLKYELKYPSKLSINSISSLYNYHLKERGFKLWQKNSLHSPQFITLNLQNPIEED